VGEHSPPAHACGGECLHQLEVQVEQFFNCHKGTACCLVDLVCGVRI
jgi:hypothetical protein